MADRPKNEFEGQTSPASGEAVGMDDLEAWFIREVLPLEAVLIQYLSRGARNKADVEDLRQDLYMKVCLAAQSELPRVTRPFVFKIARNLLIEDETPEMPVEQAGRAGGVVVGSIMPAHAA